MFGIICITSTASAGHLQHAHSNCWAQPTAFSCFIAFARFHLQHAGPAMPTATACRAFLSLASLRLPCALHVTLQTHQLAAGRGGGAGGGPDAARRAARPRAPHAAAPPVAPSCRRPRRRRRRRRRKSSIDGVCFRDTAELSCVQSDAPQPRQAVPGMHIRRGQLWLSAASEGDADSDTILGDCGLAVTNT